MVRIVFEDELGSKHEVEAEVGYTLMEVAVINDIGGIDAECGGACVCATCQVLLSEEQLSLVDPKSEMEDGLLQFTNEVAATRRLSCQIKVTDQMEGLLVRIPIRQ